MERGKRVARDEPDDEVLLRGRADLFLGAHFARELRQAAQLRGREIAERNADRDRSLAALLLRAHVLVEERVESRGRGLREGALEPRDRHGWELAERAAAFGGD